jgi:hypothetical protein
MFEDNEVRSIEAKWNIECNRLKAEKKKLQAKCQRYEEALKRIAGFQDPMGWAKEALQDNKEET